MKLALITDIHANCEAFQACLDAAQRHGAERLALLGDFVGYGADPGWVVQRVRDLVEGGAIAVKGNHDEAVVNGPNPLMVDEARRVITWTRSQLSSEQVQFLSSLPHTAEDLECLFVHANAHAPRRWAYILDRVDATLSLDACEQGILFAGHVHEPRLYRRNTHDEVIDLIPAPGVAVHLASDHQWLVLPGSAGQPRDGNPAACWALYDTATRELAFHRTPYDHARAAEKIIAAGLPSALGRRLLVGV
jgi:diadenosine tetraphosphatase ApaH/serine/threonine PP2A family protein phosphatase